jgi:hypothetical protein
MGLPPTISLLTATFPILRIGRFPAEDSPAARRALVEAATIDEVRDLFKNRRRVSLLGIFLFPAIIGVDNKSALVGHCMQIETLDNTFSFTIFY